MSQCTHARVPQVPPERVISNLAEYGNTSAASIPLALDEAVRAGSVKDGDTVGAFPYAAFPLSPQVFPHGNFPRTVAHTIEPTWHVQVKWS